MARSMLCALLVLAALLGASPGSTSAEPSLTLDRAGIAGLDRALASLRDETGLELAVVVVGTTGGESIDAISRRHAPTTPGLLLVLVLDDGRVHLAPHGLEAPLGEEALRRIEALAAPVVAAGDPAAALVQIVGHVRTAVRGQPLPDLPPAPPAVAPADAGPTAASPSPARRWRNPVTPDNRDRFLLLLGIGIAFGALAYVALRWPHPRDRWRRRGLVAGGAAISVSLAAAVLAPTGSCIAHALAQLVVAPVGYLLARGFRGSVVGALMMVAALVGAGAVLVALLDADDPGTSAEVGVGLIILIAFLFVGLVTMFATLTVLLMVAVAIGGIEAAIRRVKIDRSCALSAGMWLTGQLYDAGAGARGAHRRGRERGC